MAKKNQDGGNRIVKKIINSLVILTVLLPVLVVLCSCTLPKTNALPDSGAQVVKEVTSSSEPAAVSCATEGTTGESVPETRDIAAVTEEKMPEKPGIYTLMVYMTGSDLESGELNGFASDDLEEMMSAQDADHLNVVVETGGTKQWVNNNISNEENQRWLIENGSMELVSENLGDRNMGEPGTLSDFINWSVQNYPADKYILIFWGSGGGSVYGYGFDEKHDDDSLLLPEVEKALTESVKKNNIRLELVGFDSCLMATIETAYITGGFAEYFVASEETEPDHGWDYSPILTAISKNDTLSGGELGKIIGDAYEDQAIREETAEEITLSVIDLSKIGPIIESLKKFSMEAASNIQSNSGFEALALARNKAESYGNEIDDSECSDMVDLADLMLNAGAEYQDLSADLVKKINDAVIYNLVSRLTPYARGLSIYMPYKDRENFDYNLDIYGEIGFCPQYTDFANTYAQKISESGDNVEFADSDPGEASGDGYEIKVDQDQLKNISEIYYIVGMTDGQYDTVLGEDINVEFDEKTGVITSGFDEQWLTMDGNLISLYFEKDYEDFTIYSIPAVLNGKDVDIMATLDDSGNYKILGASELSGAGEAGAVKKAINKGDRVTPLFYQYDIDTDEESLVEGDTFTVNDNPELYYEKLPQGAYYYGYIGEDFAGNEIFSDFFDVEIK